MVDLLNLTTGTENSPQNRKHSWSASTSSEWYLQINWELDKEQIAWEEPINLDMQTYKMFSSSAAKETPSTAINPFESACPLGITQLFVTNRVGKGTLCVCLSLSPL